MGDEHAKERVAAMTSMTPEQAVRHLVENDPTFAVHEVDIRGVTVKAFKNIPSNVPALLKVGWARHGEGQWDYLEYLDESYTYADFTASVNRMAHALREDLNLKQGDRVGVVMRNYPELLMLILAISSMGGVVVLLNAWWTADELAYALGDSEVDVVFADGPRMQRLTPICEKRPLTIVGVRDAEGLGDRDFSTLRDGAKSEAAPEITIEAEDDFMIVYSSGTTGDPKGVILTHRGAMNAVFSWLLQATVPAVMNPPAPDAPQGPRPSVLVVTPLFHVTATHPLFLLSLPTGAKITLMHKWNAGDAVHMIRDNQITRMLGVPTQSADLMEAARAMGESLPMLDYIGTSGAKRPAAQVAQINNTFPNAVIATGWGMTETNALGIGLTGDAYVADPDATGRLIPPVQELKLVDDDGNEVPQGEIGEIIVKGPHVMRSYLNKPEATAEVLKEGWLHTGDLAAMDETGCLTIHDRKKNIIIRGGENIACLDVEGALHQHPDVLEAVVFSVPHDRLGETVGAAIQMRPGTSVSEAEMAEFLKQHLAKFKIPTHLWTQSEPLARGTTDKIDRRVIRAACLQKEEALA